MSINKAGVVGNETFVSDVRTAPCEPVRRFGAFFCPVYIASNSGVLRALRIGCQLLISNALHTISVKKDLPILSVEVLVLFFESIFISASKKA